MKVPVWKLSITPHGGNAMVFSDLNDALEELKEHVINGGVGDLVQIKNDEMTEEELANLPEHEGW